MFSLGNIEDMMAGGGKPSFKPKKSSKRKRQLSKGESNDGSQESFILLEDKAEGKSACMPNGTASGFSMHHKEKSGKLSPTMCSVSKYVGQESKLKNKDKTQAIQELESQLEECILVNDVLGDTDLTVEGKKPKAVKHNTKEASYTCLPRKKKSLANQKSKKIKKTQKAKVKKKKVKTVDAIGIQDIESKLEDILLDGSLEETDIEAKNSKTIKSNGNHCDSENNLHNGYPLQKRAKRVGKKSKKGRQQNGEQHDATVDNVMGPESPSKKVGETTDSYKVSEQKFTFGEKKQYFLRMQEEAKSQELLLKKQLVCYPQDVFETGKDSFVVVLLPGQSLYLYGLVSVRPLLGKVSILGYRMEELEKKEVYNFSSHALFCVQAVEGCKLTLSQHSHLFDFGLSEEQLQDLIWSQREQVVLLELKKVILPIVKRLNVIGSHELMTLKGKQNKENLWGMLITQENCHKCHLVREAEEWKELMDNILTCYECGSAPRVVVCGGKSVGKSTLFRYIVNGFLSKKCTTVQCLDVDPGQSELSVPSCVSLTQISEPLLGPSYTHLFEPSSANTKQIMIGGVTPQFGLQRYVKAISKLVELSSEKPDCPFVVNTMGWTVGTGVDLLFDTIRIVKPTHVIQINALSPKNNFSMRLDDIVVHDSLGGIQTRPCKSELHYSLTELQSLSGSKDKAGTYTPKMLRELAVMLHLSDILIDKESSHNTVILSWTEIVLHVCGAKLPRERILQVLNGNLVALCQVDSHKIESVGPDLPKHLIDDLDFGQCLGWGVIRGIDPLTRSLHILTSMPSEKLWSEVNAIIMPEVYLPDRFYKFFTKGEGPYFQTIPRLGAGKLKVGRQIKPGMATFGAKKD